MVWGVFLHQLSFPFIWFLYGEVTQKAVIITDHVDVRRDLSMFLQDLLSYWRNQSMRQKCPYTILTVSPARWPYLIHIVSLMS